MTMWGKEQAFLMCYSVQDASEVKHLGEKMFIVMMLPEIIILLLKNTPGHGYKFKTNNNKNVVFYTLIIPQ